MQAKLFVSFVPTVLHNKWQVATLITDPPAITETRVLPLGAVATLFKRGISRTASFTAVTGISFLSRANRGPVRFFELSESIARDSDRSSSPQFDHPS